jgi:hypothetical protein
MESHEMKNDCPIVLDSLEDSEERRIRYYDQITSHLKAKEKHHACVKTIQSFAGRLLTTVLKDVSSANEGLVMSALNVLVYIMFIPQLLKCIAQVEAKAIVTVLWNLLEVQKNQKTIATRVMWCLSTQQLPLEYLKDDLPKLIAKVGEVLISREDLSVAVDQEGLNVMKRFHDTCPELFSITTQVVCLKGVVRVLTSKSAKNYPMAREMAKQLTAANPELARKTLYKELSRGRIEYMKRIFAESGHHYHLPILQTWSLFVTLMGKNLHASSHKLLNEMLKIVEAGFTHRQEAIQIASYKAWESLIDNFASASDFITGKRKLKLLMTPLQSQYLKLKSKRLSLARVECWWCLISQVFRSAQANELYMEENVVPFLFACIGVNHQPSKELVSKMTTKGMLDAYREARLTDKSGFVNESMQTEAVDLSGPLSPEIPLTPISPMSRKSLNHTPPSTTPSSQTAEEISNPSLTPPPPPLLSFDVSPTSRLHRAMKSEEKLSLLYDSPLVLECLLICVQVWLGVLGCGQEVVEGSRVRMSQDVVIWQFSEWLLTSYPGLLFVSVEVCAKALRSSGYSLLAKAFVQIWTAICSHLTQRWSQISSGEEELKPEVASREDHMTVCLYEILGLLSTASSIQSLSALQFGQLLKAFHDCVGTVANSVRYQEFLYSDKWTYQSTLDRQVLVLPVHRLLEVLLTPKFEELSRLDESSFALIWELISGTLGGDICMTNAEKVFTGIYSLTKGLPSSVTRQVCKFIDSQEQERARSQSDQVSDSVKKAEVCVCVCFVCHLCLYYDCVFVCVCVCLCACHNHVLSALCFENVYVYVCVRITTECVHLSDSILVYHTVLGLAVKQPYVCPPWILDCCWNVNLSPQSNFANH